jgi:hypothetical protein
MHKPGDNTSSVWPAYVAVMACLIQIMMLLVVVLATGVMTMNSQTSSLKAAIAQLFLDQRLQTKEAQLDQGETKGAQEKPETSATTGRLIAVSMMVFQADALRLDTQARQSLVQFVNEHMNVSDTDWEIVTSGKLAVSTDKRAAFLRLLEVRQVLLELGIKEKRIQTKIEERGATQAKDFAGDNTVSIFVRRGIDSPQPQR